MKLFTAGFLSFFYASLLFAKVPHYYTADEVATKWQGVVHKGEKPRGEEFLKRIKRAGMYVGCAAAVANFYNGQLSKVFHGGVIGATFAEFILDPNRPDFVKYGAFSNDVPQKLWGIASFTTGRDNLEPNQLIPDVTGLSIALANGGQWLPWTATASRGAFGRNGVGFARLAGFPAFAKMILGVMSREKLLEAFRARQEGRELSDSAYLHAPGWWRRVANLLGTPIGETLFSLRDPAPAFGTLVPAVLHGRRSPFAGYRDIGFGTDTRLLSEAPELRDRRAFRLSFALADTPQNERIIAETPGWLKTIDHNLRGTPAAYLYEGAGDDAESVRLHRGQHLSAEFERWMRRSAVIVEYDVYMQLDEPAYPELTPIEGAHLRWRSEKFRVATLRLHSYGSRPDVGEGLKRLARSMHFSPGDGYHLPVGDLAWYRSVGRVLGANRANSGPITLDETLDGDSAVGAYAQSRDLRQAPPAAETIEDLHRLAQEIGLF